MMTMVETPALPIYLTSPNPPKLGFGTPKLRFGTPKLRFGTPTLRFGTPKLRLGTPPRYDEDTCV